MRPLRYNSPVQATISPWLIFRVWLVLGLQSWGGGSATLMLIRQELVQRRAWLNEADFTRYWAICQIAPGINLLGMTVLTGWRLAGVRGAAMALFGLMLPSVTITIALTAIYAGVRDLPVVAAALRGVIPATVGLGLLLCWQMGRPLVDEARAQGLADLLVALVLLGGSAAALILWRPSAILVLFVAGLIGALWGLISARR